MKVKRYEVIYIRYISLISFVSIIYCVIRMIINHKSTNVNLTVIKFDAFFFLLILILNFAKIYFIKKGCFEKCYIYNIFRYAELAVLVPAITYLDVDILACVMVLFSLVVATCTHGMKTGFLLVAYAFVLHLATRFLVSLIAQGSIVAFADYLKNSAFFIETLYFVAITFFILLWGMIYRDSVMQGEGKRILFEQLKLKYDQLAATQEEVKKQNDILKEVNAKLEIANKNLSRSIGEFYALQKISEAIGSILDVKELLKYVNDAILGIMGASYSSIILLDKKSERLCVYTTNVNNENELKILENNVHCSALIDSLNNYRPIIDNDVDCCKYEFTRDRSIRSLVCVPLTTKSSRQGLILIEHMQQNAFDDESVRLLDVIGRQLGIALENASLYQKTQEMATIDGLTGVYNRMYFQEKLMIEFEKAEKFGYKLSIAIFDIDYFKKFNDTYGHIFGDKVIKSIADLIRGSLGTQDAVARYGGEEFVIIYPDTGLDEAFEKVEKLRKIIADTKITDEHVSASVTASFGVACYPECAGTANQLLRIADKALYQAKASGRNCVVAADVQ